MDALAEIKRGDIVAIKHVPHPKNPGIVYVLKSGKKVMIDAYGEVTINLMDTTSWYGWRIKRALRKVAR